MIRYSIRAMYQYYGIVNDADCACRSDTSASASRALLRRLAGRPAGAAHAHGCVRAQEGNRIVACREKTV